MINKTKKIYVAGHKGMVGSAILATLKEKGYSNIICKTSKDLDLRNQHEVFQFLGSEKPDIVIDAAARVGGIMANDTYPYQFLYDNLAIQNNIINASHEHGVCKLIFLGSSCIYPKHAQQPLKEEDLLTGSLESTNQWYAVAKIAGIKLIDALRKQYGYDWVSLMPTNLYGPQDNFDLETSHVLPALIRKFHEAKERKHADVTLWGSGTPMREFLYVEDMAEAVSFTVENDLTYNMYNIGTGTDISIKELARMIQRIVGHSGEIKWDTNKPDGTPRKLLDVTKISQEGWKYKTSLEEGIKKTYHWYLKNQSRIKEIKINI